MGKAQLSLYVLAGIIFLVLFIGGTALYINNSKNNIKKTNEDIYFEANAENILSSYIESCLKQTTIEAEQRLGIDESLSPALIKQFVKDNMNSCLNNFQEFIDRGYKVDKGILSAHVTISSDTLVVKITYPVTLRKDNLEVSFVEESYTFPRTVMEELNLDRSTTISSPDGTMIIEIPPGTHATLNGENVEKVGLKILDRNFDDLSNSVVAGMLAFKGLPEGVEFDKPVKIIKYYNTFDVPLTIDENEFSLGYYNSELDIWVGVPTEVDTVKQKLTAEVMHFTPFATVKECKPGEKDATLPLEDIITKDESGCVQCDTDWKTTPLPWLPPTNNAPNDEPSMFSCQETSDNFELYVLSTGISQQGSSFFLPAPSFAVDKKEFTKCYKKQCKKEWSYTNNNHADVMKECKDNCPTKGEAFCVDIAHDPAPTNNLVEAGKIFCQATFFGYQKNDGAPPGSKNIPAGRAYIETKFEGKGDTCIYTDVTKVPKDAFVKTCTGTPGQPCVIEGDGSIGTRMVTITPVCDEGDVCTILKGDLTTNGGYPHLDISFESVNAPGVSEACIAGSAEVKFSGIGSIEAEYQCAEGQANTESGPSLNLIGGKCYECKANSAGDGYVWTPATDPSLTQLDANKDQRCFDDERCAVEYEEVCDFVPSDSGGACRQCIGGTWTDVDISKCEKCDDREPAEPLAGTVQVIRFITGMQAATDEAPKCVSGKPTGGGSGSGGGTTTCTGNEQCPSGQICHGGKCTSGGGGGGGGGANCQYGDDSVIRYPECDEAKDYVGKTFNLSSCVLDVRTVKFCDPGKDLVGPVTLTVSASAKRNEICYVMVENGGEDNYLFFDQFKECAGNITAPPTEDSCISDSDCDSNEFCTQDNLCHIKDKIAGIMSTGFAGFGGIKNLGGLTAGFNWYNESITPAKVINVSTDSKVNFLFTDDEQAFRTADKKIDLTDARALLQAQLVTQLTNDSHFKGFVAIKNVCDESLWNLTGSELVSYYDAIKDIDNLTPVFIGFRNLSCYEQFTRDECDRICGEGSWFMNSGTCYRDAACGTKCVPDAPPPCVQDLTGTCTVSCDGSTGYISEGTCYADSACTDECDACIPIVTSANVDIRDDGFSPMAFEVTKGAAFTWRNVDSTKEDPDYVYVLKILDGDTVLVQSPGLRLGESFSYTFNEAGTFVPYTEQNPAIRGSIVVADTTEDCSECSGNKFFDGFSCFSDSSCSSFCVQPACTLVTDGSCDTDCGSSGKYKKLGVCYNSSDCSDECVPPALVCNPVPVPGKFFDAALFEITNDTAADLDNMSDVASEMKYLYSGILVIPVVSIFEYNDSGVIRDMPSADFVRSIGDSILGDSNFNGILYTPWRASSDDITRSIADVADDPAYNDSFNYVFNKSKTQ